MNIRNRWKIAKMKKIIKEVWRLIPIVFFIALLARLIIIGAVLSYLKSLGDVSFIIKITLHLWALMPVYHSLYSCYFSWKDIFKNKWNKK